LFGGDAGKILLGGIVLFGGIGVAQGLKLARDFSRIANCSEGATDSARALFDGLVNGMDYQSVAVRAGAPGRLLGESRSSYGTEASYDWQDDSGARVSASFDNNRLSSFVFLP
jgi:hypothetical protein